MLGLKSFVIPRTNFQNQYMLVFSMFLLLFKLNSTFIENKSGICEDSSAYDYRHLNRKMHT